VCIHGGVDLGGVLEETLSTQAVSFIVGELDHTSLVALDDIHPAVGDTPVGAQLSSSWRTSVGVNAKVLSDTTLLPGGAACIQRTGVHLSDIQAISWQLRPWLLGTANCIGN
jgi:hypothetical protein